MKKCLAIIGALVLVVALASPSMAQFKSWGHLEIQTIWVKDRNFKTDAAGEGETVRHIAERFRFFLQYGDPKTVRAVIGFEADSSDWGEASNTTFPTGGRMGVYRADQVQLEIKWAYLEFVIPNTPVTVAAGIQNFAYGGRLFMNNDAAGLKFTASFAPHQVQAFMWRENDTDRITYRVNDTYGLQYLLAQKMYNVEAYFAYKNDLRADAFSDHPWWLGVNMAYRPGNWTFFGHFVYNGGTRDFEVGDDWDYQGWAAEASAKYRIGPGMFVGLEGFYSTGRDTGKANDINIYTVPTGSESQSIFGNDRTVFFWMNASQIGYYNQKNLAFMGMWYLRANFEYSPVEWVRMNLNYLYIGDTSEGAAGSTHPFDGGGPNSVGTNPEDKDHVGQEINLITSFNIYKAFVWHVGVAAFFPGDVYDTPTRSAKTGYGINSKLVYAF